MVFDTKEIERNNFKHFVLIN